MADEDNDQYQAADDEKVVNELEGFEHPLYSPEMRSTVMEAAEENNLPPQLIEAVINAESGFNPNAVSREGAIGPMQLRPATAKSVGVNPYDTKQNIMGGARYLRQLMDRFRDSDLALAAYNAGPTRVAKTGRVPKIRETHGYIKKVKEFISKYPGGQGEGE